MAASSNSTPPALPRWLRALIWASVLAALLGVFALYLQPDFMVAMADHVWACF